MTARWNTPAPVSELPPPAPTTSDHRLGYILLAIVVGGILLAVGIGIGNDQSVAQATNTAVSAPLDAIGPADERMSLDAYRSGVVPLLRDTIAVTEDMDDSITPEAQRDLGARYETIRWDLTALTPPAELQQFHNTMLDALGIFVVAQDEIADALAAGDMDAFNAAMDTFALGTELLGEADAAIPDGIYLQS